MAFGILPGHRRRAPELAPADLFTDAYLTSAGGSEQAVRYHLALDPDWQRHVVLQYRSVGESQWHSARQTVCGARLFGRATTNEERWPWCEPCHSIWNANRSGE